MAELCMTACLVLVEIDYEANLSSEIKFKLYFCEEPNFYQILKTRDYLRICDRHPFPPTEK